MSGRSIKFFLSLTHHDITEILLKVAFNTINHQSPIIFNKHRKRTNDKKLATIYE
jgi:hypothetical protein